MSETADGLGDLRAKRDQLRQRRYSTNTRANYISAWKTFGEWCKEHGLRSLPASAETLELYAAHLALRGQSPNSITARISAIRTVHRTPQIAGLPERPGGWPVPDGHDAAGLAAAHRRDLVEAGWRERQADPIRVQHLRRLRDSIKSRSPQRLIDVRD